MVRILYLFLVLSLTSLPAQAAPRQYRIDPDHTYVGFLVDHMGYSRMAGRFNRVEGRFVFDEEGPALTDAEITVSAASVDTGVPALDEQLKGPRYFNIGEYPDMTFKLIKTEPTGPRTGKITGNLTLLGVTKPVTLDATWNKSGESPLPLPDPEYRTGVSLRGLIDRRDFGMTSDLKFVGNQVEIIIEMEAIRE